MSQTHTSKLRACVEPAHGSVCDGIQSGNACLCPILFVLSIQDGGLMPETHALSLPLVLLMLHCSLVCPRANQANAKPVLPFDAAWRILLL